jgi:signal transduction histidine kinase/ligand-binding sensor domain-containing protein/DNA-binding response OmpR family regulator
MTQDYLGFMWFGTNNGLVKYDGYKMTIYHPDELDSKSISNSDMSWIFEDRTRNLWIAHTNGISLYNRTSDNFKNYLVKPEHERPTTIYHILQDRKGKIWLGTEDDGVLKLVSNPDQFESGHNIIEKQYIHDPRNPRSIPSNRILKTYEDKSGTLWFTTNMGLCRYNVETDEFITYQAINDANVNVHNWVTEIFEDHNENLWVGTRGAGLAKFNRLTYEFEFILFSNEIEYSFSHAFRSPNFIYGPIIENNDETFWIPTSGGGLIKFNPVTKNFKAFIHNPNDPYSLSFCNDRVYILQKDYAGILWLATIEGGVNRLLEKRNSFNYVGFDESSSDGLNHRLVSCIYEDEDGIIWIGTSGKGLNKLSWQTGDFTHYTFSDLHSSSISSNYIKCILEDDEGILWVGTLFGGLNKFNKLTGDFSPFKYDSQNYNSISDNDIVAIDKDRAGNIWIATATGILDRFDKKTGEFYHYFSPQSADLNLDSADAEGISIIYDMYIDQKDLIWFVSKYGYLNSFNPQKNLLNTYKFEKISSDINSCSIIEDTKNRIWIGRELGGLLCFNKKTKSHKIYNKENGLPDETVGAILEDDKGFLWVRTGTAICKFDPVNESFNVYELDNGYQKFNRSGAWKSKLTGEMFFAGDDGFYIFHPDSVKDNLIPPKIVLTDFRILDKSVKVGQDSPLKKHISVANRIILEHWQNDFTLEFATLHYKNPNRNQHKYKLSGYEEDWRTADANRLAKYTNMSPGEYVFQVIGSNSDGIWNNEGASLKIVILPPWWATTWAYLAYALLIIGTIYFVWRMQLRRIKIKQDYEMSKFEAEKMHEVDEMKSRFFTNISHEFRTPLTLIFGPAKDIEENCKDDKAKQSAGSIKRNASRLYALVNQLLDISKLESGKMKLEASEQNIIPLLKGYVLSFSSLAERKKITLQFNTTEENLRAYVDQDKLEKIIDNLLSNALKFTPEGGKVLVSVKTTTPFSPLTKWGTQGGLLEISISDTGMGIAKERLDKIFDRFYQVDGSHTRENEGTGIGLSLTKELVELHKGKIEVESEYGKGTTFKVLLPLGKAHLKPEEIVERDFDEEKEATIKEVDQIPEIEFGKKTNDLDLLIETDLSADKAGKPLLLIVEDNSDVRRYIVSHIEKEYRILEASNGEEGLKEALKHLPDLIISDVMMPKMNGFELCEKIKTDERTSHIPIILLTAKATDKDKISGYETGADDYIMKPFDSSVLKVRIKNLIDQRKKLREQFRKEGLIGLENKEITSLDKKFLQNVLQIINNHLSDTSFGVEILANEVSISRRNLDRKLVALTGEVPGDLIRRVRLTQAARLINQNFGNISEIALEVGFSNPAYFSKCFSEQFGLSPSEYKTNRSN